MLKARIKRLEQRYKAKRIVCFSVVNGKASGSAWWDDRLCWKDLSRGELEALQAKLEGEGVEVMVIQCVSVLPDGTRLDGWDDSCHSPQNIIDLWDANCS